MVLIFYFLKCRYISLAGFVVLSHDLQPGIIAAGRLSFLDTSHSYYGSGISLSL